MDNWIAQHESGQRLSLEKYRKIQIVLGNEAADLDSICAALVDGYYQQRKCTSNLVYIPMVSIPEQELHLRSEVVGLFGKLNIDTRNIVFASTQVLSVLDHLNRMEVLEMALMDHNVLAKKYRSLGNAVKRIVDHHHDEKLYVDAVRNVGFEQGVPTTASCCTLVAEQMEEFETIEATLLLAAVTADTVHFSTRKATPKDFAIQKVLVPHAEWKNPELFTFLQNEKFNTEVWKHSFSFRDCLIYDYKHFTSRKNETEYGISSILIPVSMWLDKDPPRAQIMLDAYLLEKEIAFMLVMSIVRKSPNPPTRELFVYSKDINLLQNLQQTLENATSLELTKKNIQVGVLYNQGNLDISRKVLVPLLQL